ncbi:CNH domain-containing protein [Fennellomyces sp. T-0311]|nr:CNH domain-containing protein [Fennellomyces sp. T-0311]
MASSTLHNGTHTPPTTSRSLESLFDSLINELTFDSEASFYDSQPNGHYSNGVNAPHQESPLRIQRTYEKEDSDDTLSPPASPSLFPRVPDTLVSRQSPTPQIGALPPSPPSPDDDDDTDDDDNDDDDEIVQPTVAQRVTQVAVDNAVIFTTRTTSLDRSNSRIQFADVNRSTGSYKKSTIKRYNARLVTPQQPVTSTAIMSELAESFVNRVVQLNSTRRIFSTEEYPLSFTGEEAVRIVRDLSLPDLPPVLYRKVARALMHSAPPLISPIQYSEKSLRKNRLYDSPREIYTVVEATLDEGFAVSVYTPASLCYSPFCEPGQGGCYSPCCPNRVASKPTSPSSKSSNVHRNISLASSSIASSHDTTLSRAWQATVPREIIKNTPEREIKRQEAIHELIYTEEDYLRDLNLLDDLFAKSLRTAQCIDEERREYFCDSVFNNYLELVSIHRDLCRDLRDYQSACQIRSTGGFVDQVGNIFLRHLHRFHGAYTVYGPHVPLAEYLIKKEAASNILLQNFLREKEKQAECRKLAFRHFLTAPVTRLQRYNLLLDAVYKKTEDDHPDRDDLARCMEELSAIGRRMDELTAGKRNTVRLYQINDALKFKPGEPVVDLRLGEKGRQLLFEGPLTRRPYMGVETIEHQIFLFDHVLLITKPKGNNYYVWRRPIPLELLHVRDGTEGFALRPGNNGTTYTNTFNSTQQSMSPGDPPRLNNTPPPSSSPTVIIQHLGRLGGEFLFHAQNVQQRMEWKQKIIEAKTSLEEAHPERKVFEIRSLSDTTFALTSGPANHGKITCSTAFVGARGIQMVAIGTEMGVWMGIEGDTNNLSKVLSIDDVTQIGILEQYHIFLVLADKTLTAYPLDALDPTAPSKPKVRATYKIASNISYFNTGVINNRTLVIAMKKKSMDSVFHAYEPVCGDLRDPQNAKFLVVKTGLFSKAPSWFKRYKQFYIGADSSSILFLKARLAVVCVRGFEILDLERLNMNHNLPELQDPEFAFVAQRPDVVPLGMFRCRDNYLLCYNHFAFMVNIRGRLIRGAYARIDWEGTPQAVAFSYPYVVAFDSQFIEVRHVETGELVQILAGENMQCLQYKQNTITPPIIHGSMTHPFKPGFQYVFHLAGVFEPPMIWQ